MRIGAMITGWQESDRAEILKTSACVMQGLARAGAIWRDYQKVRRVVNDL